MRAVTQTQAHGYCSEYRGIVDEGEFVPSSGVTRARDTEKLLDLE